MENDMDTAGFEGPTGFRAHLPFFGNEVIEGKMYSMADYDPLSLSKLGNTYLGKLHLTAWSMLLKGRKLRPSSVEYPIRFITIKAVTFWLSCSSTLNAKH